MGYIIKFRDENGDWYMDAHGGSHCWTDSRRDARVIYTRGFADKLAAMAEAHMKKRDEGDWHPRSEVKVLEI